MTVFSGALPPREFNMARYVIGASPVRDASRPALLVYDDARASTPSETWSFAEIETAVLNLAGAFQSLRLKQGDRILVRLDNTSAYAITFFAAIAAGFVPLATSTHLSEDEARFLIEDSGASAVALADHLPRDRVPDGVRVVTASQIADMINAGPRGSYAATLADDPAYMVYTSGTTAHPKGVVHAQRAAWGRRPMYEGWYGITGTDRMLHAGAFNWTFTLGTGLTDPWANGATSIILTGERDSAIWPGLIRTSGATLFAAVPGVYRQMLKYCGARDLSDLGALRHGLTAGETPPPGLFDDWRAATGLELYEALGMSEISTYISSSPSVARRAGTIGKPQPGRSVAILPEAGGDVPLPAGEVGLLAVHRSDPGLMLGYWQRPQEEAEVYRGDWFVGGDLAAIDADGHITHHGRANDIMKALGYRVAPQEVEAVMARHPAVAEVACAEREVRTGLSVIAAYIVLRDGYARPTPEELTSFAGEHLAPYKCPRAVVFVPSLPRTANGKVQRRTLAGLA